MTDHPVLNALGKRIVVTGATGHLGAYVLEALRAQGNHVLGWRGNWSDDGYRGPPTARVDLASPDAVREAFDKFPPEILVHAGAVASIKGCQEKTELAKIVNTDATILLTELCAKARTRMVYISTDLVFDGEQGGYDESGNPHPLSVYGRTKLDGETSVKEYDLGIVIRASLLYGMSRLGRSSFFADQFQSLRRGEKIFLFQDEWRSPMSLEDAASAICDIARSDEIGLLHLGGPERLSRYEMGIILADALGVSHDLVVPCYQGQFSFPERRPKDTSLNVSRWRSLFPESSWKTYADGVASLMTLYS